ncbi:hypothetical protein P775_08310 [Puniceibacterium antarcticum]|uniref:Uncharacterized protein n=2 Tax=Puniceibacterium antarcticum TaxID=1206336 RepID=A0A2G8RG71_9RHOB|nr:hypothetical protein P775_08310 [Puniceibacterium antarcticum]
MIIGMAAQFSALFFLPYPLAEMASRKEMQRLMRDTPTLFEEAEVPASPPPEDKVWTAGCNFEIRKSGLTGKTTVCRFDPPGLISLDHSEARHLGKIRITVLVGYEYETDQHRAAAVERAGHVFALAKFGYQPAQDLLECSPEVVADRIVKEAREHKFTRPWNH